MVKFDYTSQEELDITSDGRYKSRKTVHTRVRLSLAAVEPVSFNTLKKLGCACHLFLYYSPHETLVVAL